MFLHLIFFNVNYWLNTSPFTFPLSSQYQDLVVPFVFHIDIELSYGDNCLLFLLASLRPVSSRPWPIFILSIVKLNFVVFFPSFINLWFIMITDCKYLEWGQNSKASTVCKLECIILCATCLLQCNWCVTTRSAPFPGVYCLLISTIWKTISRN